MTACSNFKFDLVSLVFVSFMGIFKGKWKFLSNLDAMKRIGLKVATFFLLVGVKCLSISAQPADIVERMRAKDDSIMFKALFDLALTDGHAYKRLGELCKGMIYILDQQLD